MPRKSSQQTLTRVRQTVWDTLKAEALFHVVDVMGLDTNQDTSQLSATSVTAQVLKSLARAPSMPNAQGQARRNQPSTDRPVHHINSNDTGKEQSPAGIVHVHSVTPLLPES